MTKYIFVLIIIFFCYSCDKSDRSEKTRINSIISGSWQGFECSASDCPDDFRAFHSSGFENVHTENFAQLENGELIKPNGPYHGQRGVYGGNAIITSSKLDFLLKSISKAGYKRATVAVFFHNFETVEPTSVEKFLLNLNKLAEKYKISVIFIPAWEVNNCFWPAWPDGATRDCNVIAGIFNKQMKIFRGIIDRLNLSIKLGACLNAGFEKFKSYEYIEGMSYSHFPGIDYYLENPDINPFVHEIDKNWSEIQKFCKKNGLKSPEGFYIYEFSIYSPENNRLQSQWSDITISAIINTLYTELSKRKFVKGLDWWFLGWSKCTDKFINCRIGPKTTPEAFSTLEKWLRK